MSHIVTFKGKAFTSIELLSSAFAKLGWNVVQHTTIRTWEEAERRRTFPRVAVNPTSLDPEHYDVGLTQNESGEWTLNGDFSMSNIHDLLSGPKNQFERLQVAYNTAFLEQYALEHNGNVNGLETLGDGTVTGELEIEVDL